jgi:hypothetical protein
LNMYGLISLTRQAIELRIKLSIRWWAKKEGSQ